MGTVANNPPYFDYEIKYKQHTVTALDVLSGGFMDTINLNDITKIIALISSQYRTGFSDTIEALNLTIGVSGTDLSVAENFFGALTENDIVSVSAVELK